MKKLIMSLIIALILISSFGIIGAYDAGDNVIESEMPTVADNSQDIVLDHGKSSNSQDSNSEGAFLVLDNDADKEDVYIGDYVTWILEVQNFGPEVAKNTQVHDKLPDGLEYVKHSATKGIFNPKTGIWDIGDLKVEDGIVNLFITVKAITAGEKVNEAYITTDSNNTNNVTFEEEEIDVFEHDDDSFEEHVSAKMMETGNPLFLIFLSVFVLLIPVIKK